MNVWEWLVQGRWQNVFKDTIWMDRQNTGPQKGHLDAINDAVRTGTNVICVPDFLLRINFAIGFTKLGGRVCVCVRACSREFDRNRTAESPMTLRGDLHECPYRPL